VYYRLTKNKSNSQGQNMSDKSRRKLLKSIAAGSGAIVAGKSLPETWSRPVVDSVMLPAHAQTSACTITLEVRDGRDTLVPSGTNIVITDSQYTFSGTALPTELSAGGQVQLSWSAPDGSSGQASGTINGDGTWSIGPMALDFGEVDTATTYVATTGCVTADATWYFTRVAPQTLFTGTSSTTEANIGSSSIYANALDSIIPPASAGVEIRWTLQTHLCINDIGGGEVDVDAVIELYLDAQLSESASFAAKGITADGSTQPLGFVMHGCDIMQGNFLDQLGLINDANAGGWPGDAATITVLLGQTAMGTVTLQERAMNYAISGTIGIYIAAH
jgi:hypothetical protein